MSVAFLRKPDLVNDLFLVSSKRGLSRIHPSTVRQPGVAARHVFQSDWKNKWLDKRDSTGRPPPYRLLPVGSM